MVMTYKDFDPVSLRKQMGFMPEYGEIFHGTILDNITKFQKGEVRNRAIDILKLLGLDELVLSLPKGLETVLGGSIVNAIPKGTQQQFVIARALVDDPPVILFDNAHSLLDIEGDTKLRSAFEVIRKDRTVIMATFRPSFLNMCDVFYEMKDGQLTIASNDAATSVERTRSTFQQLKELSEDINSRAARYNTPEEADREPAQEEPNDASNPSGKAAQ